MSRAACVTRDMNVDNRVRFNIGTCRSFLPGVPDSSADCVAATSLNRLFDPGEEELLLREILRILKPGGKFVALLRVKSKSGGRSILSGFGRNMKDLFWMGSRREQEIEDINFFDKFEEVGFAFEKETRAARFHDSVKVIATKPPLIDN